MIFIVQFILRGHNSSEKYQVLGIPFLGIALLDLLHTLSYRGLQDFFTENTPQKSISFWFAARFFEVFAFLVFALIVKIKPSRFRVSALWVYAITFITVAAACYGTLIAPEIMPTFASYEGKITPLKINLEYLLSFSHLFIAWLLLSSPEPHEQYIDDLVTASLLLAIGGITFSSFADGHDILIFTGHVIKTIAYVFIFRSCLVNELLGPYLKIMRLTETLQQQSLALRKLQGQLQQNERMSMMGQSMYAVVHDTNNILGVTELATLRILDVLSNHGSVESIRKYSDTILSSLKKTKSFNKLLLEKANQTSELPEKDIEPLEATNKLKPLLEPLAGEGNELQITGSAGVHFKANSFEFEQVIMNLIVNAKDAIPNGKSGIIKVNFDSINCTTETHTLQGHPTPGPNLKITVSDNGIGISEENLLKIFDFLFTTKGEGRGTGIGLSTVKDIVQKWNGSIDVKSTLNIGTEFIIYIPIA